MRLAAGTATATTAAGAEAEAVVATAGIRATSKAGIERVGEVGFVISVLLVLVIMCFEHWH